MKEGSKKSLETDEQVLGFLRKINRGYVEKLSELERQHEENEIDDVVCVLEAIQLLEACYLGNKAILEIKEGSPVSWVYELLADVIKCKVERIRDKELVGAFVECLCLMGSSRIQAIKATAEWLRVSETTVRNTHIFFRKHSLEFDPRSIVSGYAEDIVYAIEHIDKSFPDDYSKASEAFQALLIEIGKVQD